MLAEGVASVKTYKVRARHWEHGWELHVDGVGVTQVRTLDHAKQQVCDLVETMTGHAIGVDQVDLNFDLGSAAEEAIVARRLTAEAAQLQISAAARSRQAVQSLRNAGLSLADIAHVMGVSRGRVSQLIAADRAPRVTVEYEHKPQRKAQRKSA